MNIRVLSVNEDQRNPTLRLKISTLLHKIFCLVLIMLFNSSVVVL